jgi:DNA primase
MDEAGYGRFVHAAAEAVPRQPARAAGPARPAPGRSSLVRRAVALVVHFPSQAAGVAIPDGLAGSDRPGMDLLLALLGDVRPGMSAGVLLERWREHEAWPHLQKLAAAEMLATEEVAGAELQDCLQRLDEEQVRLRHEQLFEISRSRRLDPAERDELKALDARLARRSGTTA